MILFLHFLVVSRSMEKGQTTWNHHLGSPLGLVCTPSSRQAERLPLKLNKYLTLIATHTTCLQDDYIK